MVRIITTEAAITKAMYLLGLVYHKTVIKLFFETSFAWWNDVKLHTDVNF